MPSFFPVWVTYGPLVSETLHQGLQPLNNGDQPVVNMTSNAGKDNLKPNFHAKKAILIAGKELLLLCHVIWQISNAGSQEWIISLAKSVILNVGNNSCQVFLVMQPIWTAGNHSRYINLKTLETKYLKKLDKPKIMLIKKLRKLNKVGLVKKLKMLRTMLVKKLKKLRNTLNKRCKILNKKQPKEEK